MKKWISVILAFLVGVTPFLIDTAQAQTSQPVAEFTMSESTSGSIPPGEGRSNRSASFALYREPAGKVLTGNLDNYGQRASFTMTISKEESLLQLSDGYAIRKETLTDNPALNVTKMTVISPDSEEKAVSIIRYYKKDGKAEQSGGDRFQAELQKSGDSQTIMAMLPFLSAHLGQAPAAGAYTGTSPTPYTWNRDEILCLMASIGLCIAIYSFVNNCPWVVANPAPCVGAIIAIVLTLTGVIDNCYD
jgi:hypothetical protein